MKIIKSTLCFALTALATVSYAKTENFNTCIMKCVKTYYMSGNFSEVAMHKLSVYQSCLIFEKTKCHNPFDSQKAYDAIFAPMQKAYFCKKSCYKNYEPKAYKTYWG